MKMNTVKSAFPQLLKKKELLIFPVLIITGINLIGWLSGRMGLTSFSVKFIPIPHSSAVVFITLSILLYLFIEFENSKQIRSLVSILVIVIAFYCSLIFLDFLFNFKLDAESIFIKNPVCMDTLKALRPVADLKNIRINSSSADNIIVFADIDMLKTILRNLISNAIKFTNCNGVISISAQEISGNMTISVSDNGVGMEPDRILGLFDISKVISTTGTAEEKGTGLGLLLCSEFVEKHKGKIWVESGKGKGSSFKFTLPRFIG